MKYGIFATAVAAFSLHSTATAADFTLGSGYPFVIQAQVSQTFEQDNSRVYGNYKIGLDDGFAVGYEKGFDNHSIGIMYGALGARDADRECESEGSVGGIIACPIIAIFDDETTNGFGVTYQYWFNGAFQDGWGIRLEAGYGKTSDTDLERADGNITISYQF